jgi:protein PhnA
MSMTIDATLLARAQHACELCGAAGGALEAFVVPPSTRAASIVVCGVCAPQLASGAELDAKHWFCLQTSIWSEVPAVQVVAHRLLGRLRSESWAVALLDQVYLADDILAWANDVAQDQVDAAVVVRDCNGAALAEGDAVTLIKDLEVKGAGFTAKRGTLVKGIRLVDDPTHIEGRVNGVAIYLKTEFLKRA